MNLSLEACQETLEHGQRQGYQTQLHIVELDDGQQVQSFLDCEAWNSELVNPVLPRGF